MSAPPALEDSMRPRRSIGASGRPLNFTVRPPLMRAPIKALVAYVAALQVTACAPQYSGDGTFTDFGPLSAHERYLVDLGPVDLSRSNERTFRMLGLPSTELTVGLRQVNVSAGCDAAALAAERVRIAVVGGDDAGAVSEEAPLGAWVHSPDLVYRRGAERQEPLGDGSVRLVRVGIRAYSGWGTYFTPKPGQTYIATFEVLDAAGTAGCESRLVLLGGGWK
jgi:hypothetical protein